MQNVYTDYILGPTQYINCTICNAVDHTHGQRNMNATSTQRTDKRPSDKA